MPNQSVAIHEAAHAVIAHQLGYATDVVSIIPDGSRAGVTVRSNGTLGDVADRLDVDRPAALQDSELRAQVERSVLVNLAGAAGEAMLRPVGGWADPADEDEALAAQRVRAIAGLPHMAAERLADTKPHGTTDEETAWATMRALAWDSAAHYLEALRLDAQRLVQMYATEIRAVADELALRHVLTGDDVAEIIERMQE